MRQRGEKIHMLAGWFWFFCSVTAIGIVADVLGHLNGSDNGDTGAIFWFLSTLVCGFGWLYNYSRAEDLKRHHEELKRQYYALVKKVDT